MEGGLHGGRARDASQSLQGSNEQEKESWSAEPKKEGEEEEWLLLLQYNRSPCSLRIAMQLELVLCGNKRSTRGCMSWAELLENLSTKLDGWAAQEVFVTSPVSPCLLLCSLSFSLSSIMGGAGCFYTIYLRVSMHYTKSPRRSQVGESSLYYSSLIFLTGNAVARLVLA